MADVKSGGISVSNGAGSVTVIFEDEAPIKVIDDISGDVLYEADQEG